MENLIIKRNRLKIKKYLVQLIMLGVLVISTGMVFGLLMNLCQHFK